MLARLVPLARSVHETVVEDGCCEGAGLWSVVVINVLASAVTNPWTGSAMTLSRTTTTSPSSETIAIFASAPPARCGVVADPDPAANAIVAGDADDERMEAVSDEASGGFVVRSIAILSGDAALLIGRVVAFGALLAGSVEAPDEPHALTTTRAAVNTIL